MTIKIALRTNNHYLSMMTSVQKRLIYCPHTRYNSLETQILGQKYFRNPSKLLHNFQNIKPISSTDDHTTFYKILDWDLDFITGSDIYPNRLCIIYLPKLLIILYLCTLLKFIFKNHS